MPPDTGGLGRRAGSRTPDCWWKRCVAPRSWDALRAPRIRRPTSRGALVASASPCPADVPLGRASLHGAAGKTRSTRRGPKSDRARPCVGSLRPISTKVGPVSTTAGPRPHSADFERKIAPDSSKSGPLSTTLEPNPSTSRPLLPELGPNATTTARSRQTLAEFRRCRAGFDPVHGRRSGLDVRLEVRRLGPGPPNNSPLS